MRWPCAAMALAAALAVALVTTSRAVELEDAEFAALAEALFQPAPDLGGTFRVPDNDPRLQAIEQLARIGSPKAAAILEDFLTTYGANRLLKQHALVALGRIGTEAAVEAIGRFGEWAEQARQEPAPFTFGPKDHAIDHFSPRTLAPLATDVDDDGVEWALFSWGRFGWVDFWLTKKTDENSWAKPILLDVPARRGLPPDTTVGLDVTGEDVTLILGDEAVGLKLPDQVRDGDEDGLTDVVESRLGTDPAGADTDADGVPDGQDSNPLTPKHKTEDDLTEIRQAVFAVLFATSNSQDAIAVLDKGAFAQQEYYGFGGVVLRAAEVRDGLVNIADLTAELTSATTAEATIFDYEGPEAASGHRAELRKVHGKWVVVDFALTVIS